MDIFNNIVKKLLTPKVRKILTTSSASVPFKVCEMRETYYCKIPDEILLIILNFCKHRMMLSFVSYQFNMVNRDYVTKCYHLHHYIPSVKNHIKHLISDIVVIDLPHMYTFTNLKSLTVCEDILHNYKTSHVNILHYIDELSSDTTLAIKHHMLQEIEDLFEFYMQSSELHALVKNIPHLITIDDETIKNITFLIINYGQDVLLGKEPNLALFVNKILDCFDACIKCLINDWCLLRFLVPLTTLLNLPYVDTMVNPTIVELGSMPYKKLLDKMMFVKQPLLNLINYTVNKNCIFIHVTVKGKIPFGAPLEPQYQWFLDQVI